MESSSLVSEKDVDDELLECANKLIRVSGGKNVLQDIKAIPRLLFDLFQTLIVEEIPDNLKEFSTLDEQTSTLQRIFDTIEKVLDTSLSHITGYGVATGNRRQTSDALDIFTIMFEHCFPVEKPDKNYERRLSISDLHSGSPDHENKTEDFSAFCGRSHGEGTKRHQERTGQWIRPKPTLFEKHRTAPYRVKRPSIESIQKFPSLAIPRPMSKTLPPKHPVAHPSRPIKQPSDCSQDQISPIQKRKQSSQVKMTAVSAERKPFLNAIPKTSRSESTVLVTTRVQVPSSASSYELTSSTRFQVPLQKQNRMSSSKASGSIASRQREDSEIASSNSRKYSSTAATTRQHSITSLRRRPSTSVDHRPSVVSRPSTSVDRRPSVVSRPSTPVDHRPSVVSTKVRKHSQAGSFARPERSGPEVLQTITDTEKILRHKYSSSYPPFLSQRGIRGDVVGNIKYCVSPPTTDLCNSLRISEHILQIKNKQKEICLLIEKLKREEERLEKEKKAYMLILESLKPLQRRKNTRLCQSSRAACTRR